MIVRMAKIMVMGPLELLMETLSYIQQLGILHVDTEKEILTEETGRTDHLTSRIIDKDEAVQHQLYEKLRKKIDEILYHLNPPQQEQSIKGKVISIDLLVRNLQAEIDNVKKRKQTIEKIAAKQAELNEYGFFVNAVGDLDDTYIRHNLHYVGIHIAKPEEIGFVQELIEQKYTNKAAFEVIKKGDGGKRTIGIIIVDGDDKGQLTRELRERKLQLYECPEGMEQYSLQQQKEILARNIAEIKKELEVLQKQQLAYEARWYESYLLTREWIESNLSLFNITASIVKTRMCFFIYGWLPAKDFAVLEEKLREKFNGKVVVEESELVEKDFSRIPTALHNPAYFEPFELFTRLLPMPPYASFDMTPFIGIFFPVFFGMMLGDMGYGLILLFGAVFLMKRFKKRKTLLDVGKILFICSLYTIVFGALYGELFGTVGHVYLDMNPIFFSRHESIVPMLCFSLTVGVIHVIIGLVLGVIVSLRHQMRKEAVFKLINIFVILCICVLLVSHFTQSMGQVQKPLLLTVGIVMPVLLIVGGLMAPLELLKNIGNIISYARIMAVGLTSVLLAYVANYMAGRIGSIWAGIGVAVLLHLFNILLGIFAPTIHSLRLHYVEFLSKFMEPGGKEFKPLARK